MGVVKRSDRTGFQLWNLPVETKDLFKKTCEEQGQKMVSVITRFMDIYNAYPDILDECDSMIASRPSKEAKELMAEINKYMTLGLIFPDDAQEYTDRLTELLPANHPFWLTWKLKCLEKGWM